MKITPLKQSRVILANNPLEDLLATCRSGDICADRAPQRGGVCPDSGTRPRPLVFFRCSRTPHPTHIGKHDEHQPPQTAATAHQRFHTPRHDGPSKTPAIWLAFMSWALAVAAADKRTGREPSATRSRETAISLALPRLVRGMCPTMNVSSAEVWMRRRRPGVRRVGDSVGFSWSRARRERGCVWCVYKSTHLFRWWAQTACRVIAWRGRVHVLINVAHTMCYAYGHTRRWAQYCIPATGEQTTEKVGTPGLIIFFTRRQKKKNEWAVCVELLEDARIHKKVCDVAADSFRCWWSMLMPARYTCNDEHTNRYRRHHFTPTLLHFTWDVQRCCCP